MSIYAPILTHRLIPALCLAFFSIALAPNASAHLGSHDQLAAIDARLSENPSYQLYVQRARINIAAEHYEEALSDLSKASTIGDTTPLLYDYGRIYSALGETAKALQCYDRYLGKFSQAAQVYQARSRLYQQLQQYDSALTDLTHSFTLQEHPHPGLFIEAAELAMKVPTQRTDKALDILDAGMQQLGVKGQLQEKAIEIQLSTQAFDDAIQRMQSLGIELKHNVYWQVNYAEILLKAGKKADARQQLNSIKAALAKHSKVTAVTLLQERIELLLLEYAN